MAPIPTGFQRPNVYQGTPQQPAGFGARTANVRPPSGGLGRTPGVAPQKPMGATAARNARIVQNMANGTGRFAPQAPQMTRPLPAPGGFGSVPQWQGDPNQVGLFPGEGQGPVGFPQGVQQQPMIGGGMRFSELGQAISPKR